jgi:methylmalonyl-CoA mutase N-terminal domain/subunit
LSFFFNAHNDFFEEIAKFRAVRRLWARLMKDRFGAKDPRSMMLRFHTQTAGSTLTAQQPDVNVVRVALQAMAAVMGGTQSLHTNGMDEALGLPTADAARVALRTQQVIAYETGVTAEPDPMGGSYFVEELTDRLEKEASEYLARIDAMGGTIAAIECGYIQGEIQNAAYEYQKRVESGLAIVVGVNKFQVEGETATPVFQIHPEVEAAQVAKLRELRATREQAAWKQSLDELKQAALDGTNLMPRILNSARSYATVGEISDTLRSVFGEYRESASES